MALPRPSKPTHRPRRSRHPRDSSSRIELTTLEPLHPVHYIILDHLFHLAPATYLRLSKGLHDYGTARLSAPVDFDEQLVSRFHESVKKQQDIRWLFPITQSRTIRFPSYRLFAMMVCFLSQVERQKRRKRKAGASYLCQHHPTPLFARAKSKEIRLDEAVPLHSLFQQINAQLQLKNAEYAYSDMTSHMGPRFRKLVLHHISESALSTLIRDCDSNDYNLRNKHMPLFVYLPDPDNDSETVHFRLAFPRTFHLIRLSHLPSSFFDFQEAQQNHNRHLRPYPHLAPPSCC